MRDPGDTVGQVAWWDWSLPAAAGVIELEGARLMLGPDVDLPWRRAQVYDETLRSARAGREKARTDAAERKARAEAHYAKQIKAACAPTNVLYTKTKSVRRYKSMMARGEHAYTPPKPRTPAKKRRADFYAGLDCAPGAYSTIPVVCGAIAAD